MADQGEPLVAERVSTPLVGMLHPGGPVVVDLVELATCGLALVRVPAVPGTDSGWRELTARLAAVGLPFSVNLTLATWSTPTDIAACGRAAEDAGAAMFYVADTNSAFLPQDVENLFTALGDAVGIPLGFHAHEGKSLAHANVVAARRGGALWIDASLAGFGRGAGNAATEVVHELAGKGASARQRLLRALPDVTAAFGVNSAEQLWQRLCAFIDLWSPAIELFERIGAELGVDKYSLVAERVWDIHCPNRPLSPSCGSWSAPSSARVLRRQGDEPVRPGLLRDG